MLSLQTVDFNAFFVRNQNSISCQCQTPSKRFVRVIMKSDHTQLGVQENEKYTVISDETLVSALVDDDVRRALEEGHKSGECFIPLFTAEQIQIQNVTALVNFNRLTSHSNRQLRVIEMGRMCRRHQAKWDLRPNFGRMFFALDVGLNKIHVQTNTKSVQCFCISTKHNKVRLTQSQ